MLSASKWFKQLSQRKPNSFVSATQRKACLNCQIHRLIEEQEKGKRTLWFDKFVDGCLVTSSHALPTRRHLPHTKFITTILVGVSWHWPFLAIMDTCIGNYRSVATQASSSEEELTDEFLNQILLAIENDPISAKEICTAYIEKLCKAGNLSVAARLLQSLRDKHMYLSSNAYNLLLAAAGESNDIGLVSQSFKDLLVFGEPISSISYFNIAKAFKTRNDAVLLLGFIKEVSELTFPRSATVANRIILAFAECGQIDNALLIFDHMKSLKCKPDLFTYNTVLGILGRVGRADEMLHEFASMKETNVVPDIVSYNTLINSLRKLGRLDLCLVFLKELEERGFEPDLRTYTALIESFGRSGNVEESLRLFNEMKRRCICPSIYIYRSLINNLKKMGKTELAMTLLEEMNTSQADLVGPKNFRRKNRQLNSKGEILNSY
ncbi:Pentatricopeptide repeat-containing protein [Actinidia chinensis var. chinensis]|uniref:Pentatricopeptide repeat-containing protein n=1 Tax=Actinidia chinensis var. chinensis TaxID=1590841 RepID=A0A2R6QTK3_ACTCC|nr:Pentatricopeptide repeat-containing protein [Actinidia chinensis var. chinensis]